MIIVQLTGGLGNQLFQYAMGRALSIRNGVDLKIDVSFYDNYDWHEYSLAPFCIAAKIATEDECKRAKRTFNTIIQRILFKLFPKPVGLMQEVDLLYNPKYKKILSPAYIVGYWQSEEYFIDYEEIIRSELNILPSPLERNRVLLEDIQRERSVSLHVRRGNYVNNAQVNAIHGTCSNEYYNNAIKFLQKRLEDPVFYVFSDDIRWAKENITNKESQFIFVENNDAKYDYEDLRLMQNCKHHIIANSTFSWWGAWLNSSSEKIVIAPKNWFADVNKNIEAKTIIPERWIRM